MAVTVDVYGSCVSNDLFRYAGAGKYKFSRCVTQTPITTLYEKALNFQAKNIDAMDMTIMRKQSFGCRQKKFCPSF